MADQQYPDDDRSGTGQDGHLPDLPAEWANLVVPDDARELDAVARQVRRERRVAARRAWFARLVRRGPAPFGPFGILALAVVAVLGSLVLLFPSTPTSPKQSRPSRPASTPGAAGALLPDLQLTESSGARVRLRSVRPAVVLVLPSGCPCQPLLADVVTRTGAAGLSLLVVAEAAKPLALPPETAGQRVRSLADPGWQLEKTYAPAATGPVVLPASTAPSAAPTPPLALFVRSDGLVNRVLVDPVVGEVLHNEITALTS